MDAMNAGVANGSCASEWGGVLESADAAGTEGEAPSGAQKTSARSDDLAIPKRRSKGSKIA
jgi:hypothetical protein